MTWLATNYSCPLCRGELRPKCACFMTDEDETESEVEAIRIARASRPEPTEYGVVITLPSVYDVLASMGPRRYRDNLWTHINNEIEDSMLLLESANQGGLTRITAAELLRRSDEFDLDPMSIQSLWIASRVCGAVWFYLAQFEMKPELGVWIPFIPDFRFPESRSDIPMPTAIIHARVHQGSATAQMPISTRVLCDLLRSARRLYPWERQDAIRRLYERARVEGGITHWCLVDLRGDQVSRRPSWDVRSFYALPWPHQEGQPATMAPRYSPRDTSGSLGFPEDYDQEMLRSVASLFEKNDGLDYDKHTLQYYGEVPTEVENPHGYPWTAGGRGEVELNYD